MDRRTEIPWGDAAANTLRGFTMSYEPGSSMIANVTYETGEYRVYDVWGNGLGVFDGSGQPLPTPGIGNRFLFQGREYAFASGLYNFRARGYDPLTGRWLSNDPIGIGGGLNRYAAMANKPVNFVDPFGEAAIEAHDYWTGVAVSGQDAGGDLGNLQTAGASVMDILHGGIMIGPVRSTIYRANFAISRCSMA